MAFARSCPCPADEEPRWLAHFAALQAAREHGAPEPLIRRSQSHLARMIVRSRQTLNAALARLQRRGLVRVGFRMIELVE